MKLMHLLLFLASLGFISYMFLFRIQLQSCECASKKTFDSKVKLNRVMITTTTRKVNLSIPPLYIITPTYKRPEQIAELTRMGYVLKHVKNLKWLVIEDGLKVSGQVKRILDKIGVSYEYLLAPMPSQFKKKTVKHQPRGVSNRNFGLEWIRTKYKNKDIPFDQKGALYFADDDNTYDIEIFEQIRYIKKIAMWPVGLLTKFGLSSPIVKDGKIIGFYDGWIGLRTYPIDMAGFAISVQFLLDRPNAKMPYTVGYEEDRFIKSLHPLKLSDIELLAKNCTEILTWHTQTKSNAVAQKIDLKKYNNTNLINLIDNLVI